MTKLDGPEEAASPKAEAEDRPVAQSNKGMMLKQEGKVYHVRDLATLQRWIVERRVMREDMVSFGGMVWEPAGTRAELSSFFEIVEQADTGGPDDAGGVAGAAPEHSGSWAPWEKPAVAASPPPSAPPTPSASHDDEGDSGEVLGALEAEDDEYGEESSDGNAPVAPANPRPGAGRAAPPPAGIPSSFPIGAMSAGDRDAGDPLAMNRGRTNRDHVYDAYPMDMGIDAPASPAPQVSAPVAPEPAPVPVPVPVPMAPAQPVRVPDGPVPSPSPSADRRPASRDLDWEDDRRPSAGPSWAMVGVIVLAIFGVGGVLYWKLSSRPEVPVVASAPPVTAPAEAPATASTGPAATAPAAGTEPPAAGAEAAPAAGTEPATAGAETAPAASETPASGEAAKPEVAAASTSGAGSASKPSSGGGGGSSARSLVKRGWAAFDKGAFDQARAYFVDAAAMDPSNAEAQFGVGYSSQKQGDVPTAVQRYCRARSLGPDVQLQREIDGVLASLGRTCP